MDKRRQASYLLEPPAGEVVRELLDEIDKCSGSLREVARLDGIVLKQQAEKEELVDMLEEVRKILGDRPIADKVAALIAKHRGEQ